MKEQFVTYEIALKLKELGFNNSCLASWCYKTKERIPTLYGCGALLFDVDGLPNNKDYNEIICSAPLYQQIIDWFRETYNCIINTRVWSNRGLDIVKYLKTKYDYDVFIDNSDPKIFIHHENDFANSYQEAREQAILKAIELCQKTTKNK
jgi:hypothetical protein